MIVTISGAQGQGKSTVLNALASRGYNVIPNKTARSILADWDTTLNQVYSDTELAVVFHEEVLKRHAQLCYDHMHTHSISFIERSYADIFAYALCVIGPYNKYSAWLDKFYDRCSKQQALFGAALYLTGRDYTPENDGVRSVNNHFTALVDTSIRKYLTRFSEEQIFSHKVFEVSSPDTDKRVAIIEGIVGSYFTEYENEY